ncbi:MAG: alpha-glucosidase domain-containing protein, partial [Saprospiraceae bacterium]|nr:alpha-glucosidase domain-containing protein [Saprospiraceae bacterium]
MRCHAKYHPLGLFLTCAVLLLPGCQSDGPQEGSWYVFKDDILTVQKDDGYYLISAVADNIVKVDFSEDGTPGEVYAPILDEPINVRFKHGRNTLTLTTNRVRVEVRRSPFGLSVKDFQGRQVIEEAGGYFRDGDTVRLRLELKDDEALYGTGMRALPMNRRGQRLNCYNTPHYGYEYGADDLNYAIPHVISSREYMLLVDNPARAYFDLGHTRDNILEFGSTLGNHVYYLI